MKVLHISHGIYPLNQAGTEIYTANIAHALISRGIDVTVAIPSTRETSEALANGRLQPFVVPIERAPKSRFGNKLRYAAFRGPFWRDELRRLIERVRPDVIHIQHAIGFGSSLFEWLEGFKLPLVITLHDYWLLCPGIRRECNGDLAECAMHCCEDASWTRLGFQGRLSFAMSHRRRIRRFVERARPHLAAVSRRTQLIFEGEGFPKELIHLHPLGIDVQPLRDSAPRLKERTEKMRIGFLGSVYPHKGCHILAEAFCRSRPIAASLHLFATGDEANIETLKKQYDGPDISFHGRFDHSAIAEVLEGLDVVVIPSICEETYCLVAQEALAARKIVIASNIGGLGDRFIHGINGFLVPPNDVAALSREISKIVPQWREIAQTLDFDLNLLDINDDANHWISVYEKAIAENSTRTVRPTGMR
jgi:glycosyltransferase involved in cell wall biosynthesis